MRIDVAGVEEFEHLDKDWPRVTVSGIPDKVVDTSSETTFTVQVRQENPSDVGDFTVGIYTANGTAQAPGDFTYLARDLSFPKGTTTGHAVSISVANDAPTEGRETFEIRLGIPTLVGTFRFGVLHRHTVTILDSAIDSSTVENTGPTLVESFTDGTGAEIHFTMSENLDLSNLPPASAFTVTVDGSNATVSAVARGGVGIQTDTVKLSVSPVVGQGQTVVVAYADPTAGDDANAIQDVFGNDAPSFTTGSGGVPAVANGSTVDKTPPSLVSATVNSSGANIQFRFSESLQSNANLPPASAFAVTADGSAVSVTSVNPVVQEYGFQIELSPGISQGQAVVVTYTDPTAGDDAKAIQDTLGNDTPTFTTGSDGVSAVINSSTVSMQVAAPTITGSPALSEAGTDGVWAPGETVEVTLTFSEAVTVDTTGGTPSIGLELGGTDSRSAPYLRGSGTLALVFAYTLTDADGSHTSMLVPLDSLALNGGAIRSQATSADAALSHNGAAKSGFDADWLPERGRRVHRALRRAAREPRRVGRVHLRVAFQRGAGGPEPHDGGRRPARRDRGGGDQGAAPDAGHHQQQRRDAQNVDGALRANGRLPGGRCAQRKTRRRRRLTRHRRRH